jgi:hypothetical protein
VKHLCAIGFLLAYIATARADVAIVKGAPPDRALSEGALGEAGKAMAVCWRAKVNGTLRIAIAVAADGTVAAKPISKGAAAQCAAGILAVWSVPGGAWKGEVEIGAAGAASPDLATTIQQQLVARSAPIKACQSKAPGKAGSAAIKMKIATDGSIGDVAVASKLGPELDKCVALAVTAIRIAPTGAAGAVSYQLSIAFAGKDDAPAPGGNDAPPAGATVGGGLDGAQVEAGIKKVRGRIAQCVDADAVRGKRAVVRFTIRTDGTAKNIVVKESSGDPKTDTCIEKGFTGVTFPTAASETKVNLPLSF